MTNGKGRARRKSHQVEIGNCLHLFKAANPIVGDGHPVRMPHLDGVSGNRTVAGQQHSPDGSVGISLMQGVGNAAHQVGGVGKPVNEEKPLTFTRPCAAVFRKAFKWAPHLSCLGRRIVTKKGTLPLCEPEGTQDLFNIFSAFLNILTEG